MGDVVEDEPNVTVGQTTIGLILDIAVLITFSIIWVMLTGGDKYM